MNPLNALVSASIIGIKSNIACLSGGISVLICESNASNFLFPYDNQPTMVASAAPWQKQINKQIQTINFKQKRITTKSLWDQYEICPFPTLPFKLKLNVNLTRESRPSKSWLYQESVWTLSVRFQLNCCNYHQCRATFFNFARFESPW